MELLARRYEKKKAKKQSFSMIWEAEASFFNVKKLQVLNYV